MALDYVFGGLFQDPSGNLLNGKWEATLNQPARVNTADGMLLQNIPISLQVTSGNVPNTNIYGNEQLIPTGTGYIVNLYNSAGALVRGPETWLLIGPAINLGNVTPS